MARAVATGLAALFVLLCLVGLDACGRGRRERASSAPDASAAVDTGAPFSWPVDATLTDGGWTLVLHVDPASPRGKLAIDGEDFDLVAPELALEHQDAYGVVDRPRGATPAHVRSQYRLRFSIDRCAHAQPAPEGRWPGLCGYLRDQPRPTKLEPYELLVDVESTFLKDGEVHTLTAACVPRSGAGPSCSLRAVSHGG